MTSSNLDKVPDDWIRKQTLVNAERYITPELKEFEEKILSSSEKKRTIEHELFLQLRERLVRHLKSLQSLSKYIAMHCLHSDTS